MNKAHHLNTPRYYLFQSLDKYNFTHKDSVNIMMIDDDKRDIELVKEILDEDFSSNFTFEGYTNPIKAIETLEAKKKDIDIIILDLMMPIVNGKIVLRRLKNITSTCDIPVIIHSSSHNYENVMKVIELEAHAFFEKPMDGVMFNSFVSS